MDLSHILSIVHTVNWQIISNKVCDNGPELKNIRCKQICNNQWIFFTFLILFNFRQLKMVWPEFTHLESKGSLAVNP